MVTKHTFLCVYDYGMGGIWMTIDASSANEIEKRFPDFKVIGDRPAWMTDDEYERIAQESAYDIDSPAGWLSSFIYSKERESEGKWPFMFRGTKDGVNEYRTIWARDISEITTRYPGLENLTGKPTPVENLKNMGTSDIDEPDEFLARYKG
jgi:hypothetical protein